MTAQRRYYVDRMSQQSFENRVNAVRRSPCKGGACVETPDSHPYLRKYVSRCWRHDPSRTQTIAFRLARLEKRAQRSA
jgi:hypothetical protein